MKNLKNILDGSIEGLADIVEDINAILEYKNVSIEDFEKIRKIKKNDKGYFKLQIYLELVL